MGGNHLCVHFFWNGFHRSPACLERQFTYTHIHKSTVLYKYNRE